MGKEKITLAEARKFFMEGYTIFLIPSNDNANLSVSVSIDKASNLDTFIEGYKTYLANYVKGTNNKVGRVQYFVVEGVKDKKVISPKLLRELKANLWLCYTDLNEYKKHLNLNKKATQQGGQYYGSTQLYTTRGIHFEKCANYVNSGYGSSTTYDMAFKVGSMHWDEFKKVEKDFIKTFRAFVDEYLTKYCFVNRNLNGKAVCYRTKLENGKDYDVFVVNEVTTGTNFSVYCGLNFDK